MPPERRWNDLSGLGNGHPRLGIMGLGVVGGAVRAFFESKGHRLRLYDPYLGLGSATDINEAQLLFVCVPTPYREGHGFDASAVQEAINLLDAGKTVVIKSTVLMGTTDALQTRFPQHRLLFNPEFLREATAREDFARPDRQVLGYTDASRDVAEEVLSLLPRAPFVRVVRALEAEMAKYMANAFLAAKVSFANEMYDLCAALGIDYDAVRPLVAADPRIGPSHLDVFHGGYRGYGGKCLPKDTRSLLDLARTLRIQLRMVEAAQSVNQGLLSTAEKTPLPLPARDAGKPPAAAEERVA